MPRPPHKDSLIEAALQAGDGRSADPGDSLDGEQRRVHANLERLASLKRVFGAQDSGSDPDLPERWGHLRIEVLIGEGSFGRVYRAFDPVLQREVALKLRSGCGADGEAAGFIAEARRLARVRHPNVLAVHGADVHDGRVGIWTDLLKGETLQQRVESGILGRSEIAVIAAQLAAALGAIHAIGLVHGDVKVGNVMLDGGHATLMDFGAGSEAGARPRYGTPASMAPEQLNGASATAAGDIFSLGVLLHQLAIGCLPESARGRDETSMHAKREIRQRLGKPMADLLATALATDPLKRPAASEIQGRLRRIAGLPRRRRRIAAVTVVLASLSAGLIISLVALQHVRHAQQRSEAVTDFLVDSVRHVQPEQQHGPTTLSSLFDTMAKNAEASLKAYPDALARMWLVTGRGLSELGEPERGRLLATRGLHLLERRDPAANRERALALAVLATLHKNANDMIGAEKAARASIALWLKEPPSDDRSLEIIHVRTLLGNVLTESGRWREAVSAHRAILEDRKRLLGADASALAVDYYNLGVALQLMDQATQARDALRKALELMTAETRKAASVHVLFIRQGLAKCELDLGHIEHAQKMLQAIRPEYEKFYPADHINVLRVRVQLAEAERLSGHPQDALGILKTLPESIYRSAGIRLTLVRALIDSGDFNQAYSAALPLRAQMSRHADPRGAYVPALLAWLEYRNGGDASEALHAIKNARAEMRRAGYDKLQEASELARWQASLQAGDSAS